MKYNVLYIFPRLEKKEGNKETPKSFLLCFVFFLVIKNILTTPTEISEAG